MENKVQHIRVPNDMCLEGKLDPMDVYVYASLKTYMNGKTYEAFPSLDTLSKEAKVSRPVLVNSLDNLVKNGDLTVRKEGRKNVYKFNPFSKNFEMFTYKFMKDVDLTVPQRVYLILVQQFMIKDEDGIGKVTFNNNELADRIGLSTTTIYRRNKELTEKGILQTVDTKKEEVISGLPTQLRIFDLSKIAQDVLFLKAKVQEHDITLKKHSKEIKENTKTLKTLMNTISELKEEINELKENNKIITV